MSQCLASKPSMRPTFADIADRLRQMQDEDAEGALPGAMNSVGIGAAVGISTEVKEKKEIRE